MKISSFQITEQKLTLLIFLYFRVHNYNKNTKCTNFLTFILFAPTCLTRPTCPTRPPRPTCPTCPTYPTRPTRPTCPTIAPTYPAPCIRWLWLALPPAPALPILPSAHPSQKKFLNTLTLYKPYTNDTGRANDKRTLTEV